MDQNYFFAKYLFDIYFLHARDGCPICHNLNFQFFQFHGSPPNRASLMGFRELLIQRRHYDNLTLREMLKDQTQDVQQRIDKSEGMKSSSTGEARPTQGEADELLGRRFLKLGLRCDMGQTLVLIQFCWQ